MLLIHNGRPVRPLIELARKYGIEVSDDVSAEELNAKLQETWFKAGYRRYQIVGDPPAEGDRALLEKLDCVRASFPVPNKYRGTECWHEYAGTLVLGALRTRFVSRLHYLTRHDVVCAAVFLLGGQRELDDEYRAGTTLKESASVLCSLAELSLEEEWTPPTEMPRTEAGMIKLVVEQSVLPRFWTYYVVDAAKQPVNPQDPGGEKRAPNTAETIRTLFDPEFRKRTGGKVSRYGAGRWVEVDLVPSPGAYLAVSNQPFVEYQRLAVQRALPPGCNVVACGPTSSLQLPLATYLDNLAKQLQEELQMSKT